MLTTQFASHEIQTHVFITSYFFCTQLQPRKSIFPTWEKLSSSCFSIIDCILASLLACRSRNSHSGSFGRILTSCSCCQILLCNKSKRALLFRLLLCRADFLQGFCVFKSTVPSLLWLASVVTAASFSLHESDSLLLLDFSLPGLDCLRDGKIGTKWFVRSSG